MYSYQLTMALVNGVCAKPTRWLVVSVVHRRGQRKSVCAYCLSERTIYRVEPLQEALAVEKVETLAARCANIVNNQIDEVGRAVNQSVESALNGTDQPR